MRRRHVMLLCLFASGFLTTAVAADTFLYTYNDAGRLESVQQGNVLVTYTYDPAGNVLSRNVPEPGMGLLAAVALGMLAMLRRRRALALVPMLLLLPETARAVSVCKPAMGMCDYETIKDALTDPMVSGQTVTVMADTYMESNLMVGQRTLISDDPMNPESTIIDATGSDFPVIGGAASATIQGFTIRGGDNLAAPGGGVRTTGGSVTLRHLIIENNHSFTLGGGVGSNSGGNVTIEDCKIRNNSAERFGGGVAVPGLVMRDTTILGNFVTGPFSTASAGGVYIGPSQSATIEGGTIQGNYITTSSVTNSRGAGLFATQASVVLDGVTILGNIVQGATNSNRGGGIYFTSSSVNVSGGFVGGNTADQGGGIYLASNSGAYLGVTVSANSAATEGGGIYCTAANQLDTFSGLVSGNGPDQTFGCDASAPPGGSVGDGEEGGELLDPVKTFSGEMYEFYVDLQLGGPSPLAFGRIYASGLEAAGITGRMGRNWRHSFEWDLAERSDGVSVVTNEGRVVDFTGTPGNWTLASPLDIAFQLDETADVFTLLDPRTRTRYRFDETGKLSEIIDNFGNTQTLLYLPTGELDSAADGFGRTFTFTYNALGRVASVNDGFGRTVTYMYAGVDLATYTDAVFRITEYQYISSGLMSTWTLPKGNEPFVQTYDGMGRVDSQTDASGNEYTLEYVGLDTTITDPALDTQVHTHNAMGELQGAADEAGMSAAITSDSEGRRGSVTDRMGATTGQSFDGISGRVSQIDHADGTATAFGFVSRIVDGVTQRDLSQVTHRDGSTETFVVDANGDLTSHTDQEGAITTITRDTTGEPIMITNPEGGTTTRAYNADRTIDTLTDTLGELTSYTYDSLKRLAMITHPDASTTTFTADAADQVMSVVDENGNVTSVTYDDNGNIASLTNGAGETTQLSYDDNDRLIGITQPTGETTVLSYDALGRLFAVQDENGNTSIYGYDLRGRLVSITDPLGNTTSYTYDDEGVLASVTDAMGNTTTFVTDVMGRITSQTSPLGAVTQLGYDTMGRLVSTIDPTGRMRSLTRNSRGEVMGTAGSDGNGTSYVLDGNSQITQVTDANGNDWMRTFDAGGRLVSNTDPLGNARTVDYDDRGRPETITLPGGMGTETRAYDPAGNLVSRTFSDGTVLNYGYDGANRLVSAGGVTIGYDTNGRMNESNGITAVYDPAGRMTSMTLAPGRTITYEYDDGDRLTQVTDWEGGVTTFQSDPAGRRTQITRANGIVTTRTFDDDGRLSGITDGAISNIAVTRDLAGRVVSEVRNTPTVGSLASLADTSATFDAAHRRSGRTHDPMGRPLTEGARNYTWDLASRLTNVSEGADSTDYDYDDLDNLITRPEGKEIRALTRNYLIPGAPVSIDDDTHYVHTPDGEVLSGLEPGFRYELFFDAANGLNFTADENQNVLDSGAFSPYGESLGVTNVTGTPYWWQGEFGALTTGDGTVNLGEALWADLTGGVLGPLGAQPLLDLDQEGPYDLYPGANWTKIRPPRDAEEARELDPTAFSEIQPLTPAAYTDNDFGLLPEADVERTQPDPAELAIPDDVDLDSVSAQAALLGAAAKEAAERVTASARESARKWTKSCPTLGEALDPLQEKIDERNEAITNDIRASRVFLDIWRLKRLRYIDVANTSSEARVKLGGLIRKTERRIRRMERRIRALEEELAREPSVLLELNRIVVLC